MLIRNLKNALEIEISLWIGVQNGYFFASQTSNWNWKSNTDLKQSNGKESEDEFWRVNIDMKCELCLNLNSEYESGFWTYNEMSDFDY